MKQKTALALGSGGARGLAHIGVIEELEDQGYEISADSARTFDLHKAARIIKLGRETARQSIHGFSKK